MCKMFRTLSYNVVQLGFALDSPGALGLKVVALQAKLFVMSLNTAPADKNTEYISLGFLILKTSAALQLVVCSECFFLCVRWKAVHYFRLTKYHHFLKT